MEIGEVQSNNQMKQIHTRQSMVDSNPWQESLPLVLNAPPKPSSTTHHPLLFHGLIVHQSGRVDAHLQHGGAGAIQAQT